MKYFFNGNFELLFKIPTFCFYQIMFLKKINPVIKVASGSAALTRGLWAHIKVKPTTIDIDIMVI